MSRNQQATELIMELQPGLDLLSVGAKSANLGKAIEHGFRVPPGFVITRQALNLFLEQSNLLGSLHEYLDHPSDLPHTERTKTYQAFCQKLLATSIPKPLIDAAVPLADALFAETPRGLAVRSSSIYEDSATASFAGVFESFLGIHSFEGLWAAIQQCWCSAWAPLALDYAQKMGVEPEPDAMAVLVQPVLPADSAGVLFTADPLTGNPWRFVLESSFGLARDLVASTGAMPVDRFLFEWDTGEILGRDIAPKKTALFPGVSGIDNIDIPPDRQTVPSLDDDLATHIAQVGLQIDRALDARVDVEWVVEGDDIQIVQVRPITALPAFFPHHLPAHLVDRTWLPAKRWHFPLRNGDGTVTLPIYRDKLITEKHSRSLEVGPVETPTHRKCGAEMDFHGHRYLVRGEESWPQKPPVQLEQYLVEYELQIRSDFLHSMNTRFPAIEQRAMRLENEAKTLEQAIDAILWALEEMWGLGAALGPSQHLCFKCRPLLNANKTVAEAGAVIQGKPSGPGSSQGIVRRIETLEEGDDVGGEEDVMVLIKPVRSTNWHVPLLFSMLLRVRGLIVPDAPGMWMNHISQIARECRVPIVKVAPSDLDRLVEDHWVEVDGTRGIVTTVDA